MKYIGIIKHVCLNSSARVFYSSMQIVMFALVKVKKRKVLNVFTSCFGTVELLHFAFSGIIGLTVSIEHNPIMSRLSTSLLNCFVCCFIKTLLFMLVFNKEYSKDFMLKNWLFSSSYHFISITQIFFSVFTKYRFCWKSILKHFYLFLSHIDISQ